MQCNPRVLSIYESRSTLCFEQGSGRLISIEGATLMDALDNYRSQRQTETRERAIRWFPDIFYPFITARTHQEACRRGFEKC